MVKEEDEIYHRSAVQADDSVVSDRFFFQGEIDNQ